MNGYVIFNRDGLRTGGAMLLAVVVLKPNEPGRHYRLSTLRDYQAIWETQKKIKKLSKDRYPGGLNVLPNEPTPTGGGSGASRAFSVHNYGMTSFDNLYTARQLLALNTITNLIKEIESQEGKKVLSLCLSKLSELACSLCAWEPLAECPRHIFSRQVIPITWDFAEGVLTSESSGSFIVSMKNTINGLESLVYGLNKSSPQIADACDSPLPDQSCSVWFTDPPYYDAVPYAELSDFFYVWLKRLLPNCPVIRDPFDSKNVLVPKKREIIQDEVSHNEEGDKKDRDFYESSMSKAFAEGRRILSDGGIGCVVFAHKTTEGWEALLSGMISGGWTITGSWPIATEMASRLRARESAALATSIHLICRPRSDDALTGDWAEVLHELPDRVGDWMERLQNEGVRGADLVFACIGPALEIFSRYRKVETPDGKNVSLAKYLEKVWEVVGRVALEQILGTDEAKARNGVAGALEEDSRLTALFLWTIQSTKSGSGNGNGETDHDDETSRPKSKGYSLIFDVVRRFAQPLGINLPKWENRVIETQKGVVRLLPISERTDQLFGKDGAKAMVSTLEKSPKSDPQMLLFPDMKQSAPPQIRSRGKTRIAADTDRGDFQGATTLDRVHAAMVLQAGGQPNALRALIKSEQNRGPEFLRLSNALSALYPRGSEEKRLLDAMLLAVPR